MKVLIVVVASLMALLVGVTSALVGGLLALLIVIMVVPVVLLIFDYRIGVAAMAIVLPFASSPLLPRAQGLDVTNYLVALSLLSLLVPRLLGRQPMVLVPRAVVWLFLAPVTMGIIVAWPHVREGVSYMRMGDVGADYTPFQYAKIMFLKPMGWLIFAMLIGNAMRDSKKPERWLWVLAASAVGQVAVVCAGVVLAGGNLSVLQSNREFLSGFGLHANDFGLMLMTAAVPLVFVTFAAKGGARIVWASLLAATVIGLVLTFSRGAWLGFIVGMFMFVRHKRQWRVLLWLVPVLVFGIAFAPQGVIDRLTTGFGERSDNLMNSQNDELSAGRVASWRMLAPEILRSPVIGRGIGSTAWSAAAADGSFTPSHPHNLYLAILMDLGLVGAVLLGTLYYKYLRGFKRLGAEQSMPPLMRAYFAGAGATFVAVLVMGLTNLNYMPGPQYTYVWFSFGMLFAYWPLAMSRDTASEGDAKMRMYASRGRARMIRHFGR